METITYLEEEQQDLLKVEETLDVDMEVKFQLEALQIQLSEYESVGAKGMSSDIKKRISIIKQNSKEKSIEKQLGIRALTDMEIDAIKYTLINGRQNVKVVATSLSVYSEKFGALMPLQIVKALKEFKSECEEKDIVITDFKILHPEKQREEDPVLLANIDNEKYFIGAWAEKVNTLPEMVENYKNSEVYQRACRILKAPIECQNCPNSKSCHKFSKQDKIPKEMIFFTSCFVILSILAILYALWI